MVYRAPGSCRVLRGEWVRSTNDPVKNKPKPKGTSAKDGLGAGSNRVVGDALREAYEEAVSEGVPDDMLDLLKKLD